MSYAYGRIAELLQSCGTPEGVLPPTALYNEGWMLRLVLDWFSRQPPSDYPLAFDSGARWYSEVLLPTQFRARWRGDDLAESWTHANDNLLLPAAYEEFLAFRSEKMADQLNRFLGLG